MIPSGTRDPPVLGVSGLYGLLIGLIAPMPPLTGEVSPTNVFVTPPTASACAFASTGAIAADIAPANPPAAILLAGISSGELFGIPIG